jgi:hypothetical protein
MKKLLLLTLLMGFISCGSGDPSGEYRVGGSYSYFSSDGSVSFYNKSSSGLQNCKTEGNWKKKDENIYVSGLYNNNCSGMSSYNGKYLIEGSRLVGPR